MGWASGAIERLRREETVAVRSQGHSTTGKVDGGDTVTVEQVRERELRAGDAVLCNVHWRPNTWAGLTPTPTGNSSTDTATTQRPLATVPRPVSRRTRCEHHDQDTGISRPATPPSEARCAPGASAALLQPRGRGRRVEVHRRASAPGRWRCA